MVDTSESISLPSKIKERYLKGGASVPIVILTDPGMETIYGSFNHPQMKGQKYGTIFREAKDEIKKAIEDGSFSYGEGNEPTLVKVPGGKIENWTSAKGSALKAKLTGIENDTIYLFETAAGKIIRATANQLSPESISRARKLAGLN